MIVEVSVSKSNFAFDKLFCYSVPDEMIPNISIGSRVKVPFGKGNSLRSAFVVHILDDNEFKSEISLKNIDSLIDNESFLDQNSIDIAKLVSNRYFCPLYDSLSVILPSYVKYEKIESECSVPVISEISLSDYQSYVYDQMMNWFYKSDIKESLLYGITGSGKTNLFLKLAQDVVSNDKKVLILVPEISLIPQMIFNIERFFGKNSFACLHSGLTPKKRSIEWQKINNHLVRIVIGTRSAIFAPFCPDLIIIDEEQEPTYKSDKSPRFNAKEIAKFFCKKYNSKLLLSSATPSVDVFYSAKMGKKELFELKKRYGNSDLPDVQIVSICKNFFDSKSVLSDELIDSIRNSIAMGKQSILLLDRRGYHTLARCFSCGESVMCKNCSTTLNHHKIDNQNKLICHYCGYIENVAKKCKKCGKDKVFLVGVGTQNLEKEISDIIPESKCVRVDADTTKSKKEYEKIFKEFRDGKYNVMVGTRMVAKGLDFENINLVGIICADQSLTENGYKVFERTFSLISQAVGRSGRHDSHGQAIIQSYSIDNPIIQIAASQDYDRFFENEISIRKTMLYPPFADICTVGFVGSNEKYSWESCLFFFESLKFIAQSEFNDIPLKILSPSKAFLTKLQNKFRFKIVIKCKNNSRFRSFLFKSYVNYDKNDEINGFKISKKMKSAVNVFFDMNSEHLF